MGLYAHRGGVATKVAQGADGCSKERKGGVVRSAHYDWVLKDSPQPTSVGAFASSRRSPLFDPRPSAMWRKFKNPLGTTKLLERHIRLPAQVIGR